MITILQEDSLTSYIIKNKNNERRDQLISRKDKI